MIDKTNRKELIEALEWNIRTSVSPALTLHSVLADLLAAEVNLSENEIAQEVLALSEMYFDD